MSGAEQGPPADASGRNGRMHRNVCQFVSGEMLGVAAARAATPDDVSATLWRPAGVAALRLVTGHTFL